MTPPPRNAQGSARARWLRRYWRYELIGLGMIAAIWLVPALLNQGQKLCACGDGRSQARTYVGSMNRAQQAHWIEQDGFGDRLDALGLNIASETEAYQYSVKLHAAEPQQNKTNAIAAFQFGQSRSPELPSYVGGVFETETAGDRTPVTILCEATEPGQPIAPPLNAETCAPGSTRIR